MANTLERTEEIILIAQDLQITLKENAETINKSCQQNAELLSNAAKEIKRCTTVFNTHYLSVGLGGLFLGALLMHVVNVCINNDAISREFQAVNAQASADELQAKYSKYKKYEPLLEVLHGIDLKDESAVTLENNINYIKVKGKQKYSEEEVITLAVKREYSTVCRQSEKNCYLDPNDPNANPSYVGTGERDELVFLSLKK